jgi:phospholipase C
VPIDHVVVLCLENRSFDHLLGHLDHPDPAFEGLRKGGPHANPGWDGGPPVEATPHAKRVLPFGPDHSHDAVLEQLAVTGVGAAARPTNQGFVTSYERKARGLDPPAFGGLIAPLLTRLSTKPPGPHATAQGRGPLVMLCQPPEQVPVLSRLALEFAVFDHWFCSVPGETWPNRNFLHAATSDGETNIELRPYTDRTIFDVLEDSGQSWRIYHDDTPQIWAFPRLWDTPRRHANWHPTSHFAREAAAGDLPAYSFIEPNHRPPFHTMDHSPLFGGAPDAGSSQHPENNLVSDDAYDGYDSTQDTDFARSERLVATVYEGLRANPALFARTLLLITYDEHGGFFDHVPPPTGVPAPGDPQTRPARLLKALWHRRATAFVFHMLGPRVPTVAVSPLIPAGTLVAGVHEHASVPATLRALFAPHAEPLTARDAWATPVHGIASLDAPRTDLPDLSAATVAPPPARTAPAAPERVPEYYWEFVRQADQVRDRLAAVGEPEIAPAEASSGVQRGQDITAAFAQAAHRHRHEGEEDAGSPSAVTDGRPNV